MRILCLHGSAISGEIFKSKTTKLRSLLPQEYTYEWLNGPTHVTPIKLLSDAYPPPYLSHVETVTTEGIADAISTLEDAIEDDGPFDGVMAICEGAMLVSSLLFKHQMEKPTSPPLFRFAIFIAGAPPFTWTDQVGQDVFDVLVGDHPLCLDKTVWQDESKKGTIDLERLKECRVELMRDLSAELVERTQIVRDLTADPKNAHLRPHALHPELHPDRLDLPTAHIWGRQDILSKHSEHLLKLCSSELAEVYLHDGEHDVPRSWPDNEAMSEVIQKTILRSEFAL